jgi:S1-C subfamily serine protease
VILAGGDIVTALGDTGVKSMQDLVIYLETRTRVGNRLQLTLWRDGKEQQMTITVGERPMG